MVAAAVAALFPARSAQRGVRAARLGRRHCGPGPSPTPVSVALRPGPARPRPGLGDRAPTEPRLPGPGSRRSRPRPPTPSFVCSRLQGPLPLPPLSHGAAPPGPASLPLAGPGQKMVQEENSRTSGLPLFLQGEGQGRFGGAPRAGPLTSGARPQFLRLMPTSPLPGAAPAWYSLQGRILGQSPVSSTLGPVGSFFQELPSLWGLYPCVPMKTPARHVLVWGGIQYATVSP